MSRHTSSISSISIDPRNPYAKKMAPRAEVDPLVGQLLDCLMRTAVPAVDELGFEEILSLREAVDCDLGQLRAELACLTPALREFSGEKFDPIGLAREAKFIIESRIVPEAIVAAKAVKAKKVEIAKKAISDTVSPTVIITGSVYLLAPPVALLIPVGGALKVLWEILSADPVSEMSATSRVLFRLGVR